MKNYKYASLDGTVLHYDVPTKCQAVEEFMKSFKSKVTKDSTKAEIRTASRETYDEIAELYGTTSLSVRYWVKKYFHTYKTFKNYPTGVMRVATTLVEEKDIQRTKQFLEKQKEAREVFAKSLDNDSPKKRGVKNLKKAIIELL